VQIACSLEAQIAAEGQIAAWRLRLQREGSECSPEVQIAARRLRLQFRGIDCSPKGQIAIGAPWRSLGLPGAPWGSLGFPGLPAASWGSLGPPGPEVWQALAACGLLWRRSPCPGCTGGFGNLWRPVAACGGRVLHPGALEVWRPVAACGGRVLPPGALEVSQPVAGCGILWQPVAGES